MTKKWMLLPLLTGITGIFITAFKHSTLTSFVPLPRADTVLYPEEKHFKNIQQLTSGGDNAEAYFSYDGQWLVFQRTSAKDGLPCDQLFVGKIPAPAFMPDGKHIIFASNHEYKRGYPFNLYTIQEDGSQLQKISRDKGFDAFPMFSPNDKKIVFCSNRNNGGTHDTNIFIADWED